MMKTSKFCSFILLLWLCVFAQIDSFETGGAMRSFLIHVPAGLSNPALVISMHHATGDAVLKILNLRLLFVISAFYTKRYSHIVWGLIF